MAWRSSGSSNIALIENLAKNGLVNSDRVKRAMLAVDRGNYSPSFPYDDSPQQIGHQATISAPHMHASAAESILPFLKPEPSTRILDIGSGSGYLTHVLAKLVDPVKNPPTGAPNPPEQGQEAGTVIGIDHIQALVDLANGNMAKSEDGRRLLESGKVQFVKGDGRKGWKEGAPYDAIHVGAAAAEHHQELVEQLKTPGRLFVPVEENYEQYIFVIDKKEDGSVKREKLYPVRYVPLTDAPRN
ncbi:MAG: hypothetical protein M1820_005746 [Bogoriella megaspora]|nr:MAG: hypothetical protein M1820_005746 [Bogoriella megaspora]